MKINYSCVVTECSEVDTSETLETQFRTKQHCHPG
jgi:hypothetical protein